MLDLVEENVLKNACVQTRSLEYSKASVTIADCKEDTADPRLRRSLEYLLSETNQKNDVNLEICAIATPRKLGIQIASQPS